MRKMSIVIALLLTFAASFAAPALSADLDKTVLSAAEKVLSSMPADFYQVAPEAAKEQIENAKPLIIDVREAAELAKGKIAGATNIPIRELPKMDGKLPANKTAPILVYCQVGYRGGIGMTVLRMLGYTNVKNVRGGLDAWEKAGLPVVDKKS